MVVIHKFPLKPLEINKILLPDKNKILHIGFQDHQLMLWVLIDYDAPEVEEVFYPLGTGTYIDIDPWDHEYVGTAVSDHLVWHVFHLRPTIELGQ